MIEINNLTKKKVQRKYLENVTEEVLRQIKKLKVPCLPEGTRAGISLVFVGESEMKSLNRKYRGKNRPTDVLSFSQIEGADKFVKAPSKDVILGEVVICLPYAEKQAKSAGHSLKFETVILLIHGILHLVGYDHERSEKDAEAMEKLEEKIKSKIISSISYAKK